MKRFFGKQEEIEEIQEEMDIINLDETAEWSKLDIAEEMIHDTKIQNIEESRAQHRNERKEDISGEVVPEEISEDDWEEEPELESLAEEDIEYLSDDDEDDEEEEEVAVVHKKRKSVMDMVVAATGILVLVVAIATGSAYLMDRGLKQQIEAFAPLGEQLETIGEFGEDKLYAVADARKAMLEAAKMEQEAIQQTQPTEQVVQEVGSETPSEIKVVMKMTSVEKDLKIKFVNKKDGKLIKKVPFEVKITDVENKTYHKKDEDGDGIIYLTGLKAGSYSVTMVELGDMEGYSFSTATQTAKVKETIVYEKIDVTEEIKDQSEVDVTKEDTAQKIETENVLTDTVEWVESTKTEKTSQETYTKVSKDTIADPALSASLHLDLGILKMMQQSVLASNIMPVDEAGDGNQDASQTTEEGESEDNTETGDNNGEGGDGSNPDDNGGNEEGNGSGGSDNNGNTDNGGDTGNNDKDQNGSGSDNNGSEEKPAEIPATSVSLNFTQLTLEEGSENNLLVSILPKDTTDKVTWSSSDTKVVKVSDGKVTAVGPGDATITVKVGEKSATCSITVTAKKVEVKGISISESLTLKQGDSVTLSVKFTPENATDQTIKWTTEDKKKATVDENGKVTAVAAGTVKITATSANGKKAVCTVTVAESNVAVKEVKLEEEKLEIEVGQTKTLTPVITPDNASNKEVIWISSDEKIAKIDEEGKLSALKEGQTTITVVTKDGEKKAQCVVTVKKETPKVTMEKTEATMKVGETLTLKVKVTSDVKEVAWKSSDEKLATVKMNGEVTAKAKGKVTITATALKQDAVCEITITDDEDAKNDTTTLLKDKSGNQMYILVDDKYIEAKAADYYKYDTFYKKEAVSEYSYTGWQNLDGRTYYFDKEGNKVTGEQIIQGAKYNFNSDGSLNTGSGILGIDVSTWNGDIDWSKVKNSGVSYAIIRSGFRGSTQGALVEDNRFRQNIQGAANAGLKVGIYFFSQAVNEVEAIEEASMVLSQVKGYNITYPIFIDVEPSGGRADKLSSSDRTKVINAFCQTIQNGGYRAGIYANKTWLNEKMNISALSGYKIWLAQYNSTVTYGGKYDIWQYSDKGTVSGIKEKVDMNLSFLTY